MTNEPNPRDHFLAANQKSPVIACTVIYEDGVATGVEYTLGDRSKHRLRGDHAIGLPEPIRVASSEYATPPVAPELAPAPKRKAKAK